MRISATPAFSKFGIPGPLFVNPGVPIAPVFNLYGWDFDDVTTKSVMTGAFSPHQIIKPGKDTVDVEAYLWWLGDIYHTDEAPVEKIGWLSMIVQARVGKYKDSYGWTNPLTDNLSSLDPEVVTLDTDGHIDWEYLGNPGKINGAYPYMQFAAGYESITEEDDVPTGTTELTLYRTQLKLVKKVGGALTLDSTVAFKEFSALLSSLPVGEVIHVWRMQSGGGGALADGFAGETDNYTGTGTLLGIEIEVV